MRTLVFVLGLVFVVSVLVLGAGVWEDASGLPPEEKDYRNHWAFATLGRLPWFKSAIEPRRIAGCDSLPCVLEVTGRRDVPVASTAKRGVQEGYLVRTGGPRPGLCLAPSAAQLAECAGSWDRTVAVEDSARLTLPRDSLTIRLYCEPATVPCAVIVR